MSNGYPDGCTQATHDAAFCPDGGVSENAIERVLEERAEGEMWRGADEFRIWLVEHATAHGDAGVALVCTVVGGERTRDQHGWMTGEESRADYLDRIADARRAVERDYVAYRTATASEDERDEIARELRDDV